MDFIIVTRLSEKEDDFIESLNLHTLNLIFFHVFY